MRYYNYIYLDPRKPGHYSYEGLPLSFLFEPFYVGKGTGKRLFAHLGDVRSKKRTLKINKIKAILRENLDLKSHIIQINPNLTSEEAYDKETQMIRTIGRISLKTGPLTNMNEGGAGGNTASKEAREKMSISQLKNKRKITEKHRLILIQTHKGKILSEETKNKIREGLLGHIPSPESNKKRSQTLKGRPSKIKGRASKFKGISRDPEIIQKAWETRHQRTYLPVKYDRAGEKSHTAKTFIFISPTGDTFTMKGCFKSFCHEHGLKICRMLNHFDRDWICFKVG